MQAAGHRARRAAGAAGLRPMRSLIAVTAAAALLGGSSDADGIKEGHPCGSRRQRQRLRRGRCDDAGPPTRARAPSMRRLAGGHRGRGAGVHGLARSPWRARPRATRARPRASRGGCAGRSRSTRLAAAQASGCARPRSGCVRESKARCCARRAARMHRSGGSATRRPEALTIASSSWPACRARSSAWGPPGPVPPQRLRPEPASGARSFFRARRTVERALHAR